MRKEHEDYFSTQMHTLADKFNAFARSFETATDQQRNNMRDDFQCLARKLEKEFTQAGYTPEDWNELMKRSGAGKKMGMGG